MTIRGRVTLWYVAVLLISFVLAAGGMYYELVYERNSALAKQQNQDPMEEEVGEILLYFILPAMVVTVLGGWWLLRRSLAPLDQLTTAAERISAENPREALPRTFNGDEVDRLSEVLNAMNKRLSGAMDEIQEFTLHASHELKTPLTILHSEIEAALSSWPLSPAQRQSLGSQLDEIQRLTRIVEGLHLLARLNSGQVNCAREAVSFHTMLQEIADDLAILARPKEIQLSAKIAEPMTIVGDHDRLRQMFLNLADNAVKYNHQGGSIKISSQNGGDVVEVQIGNTGPGIRPADLGNLFDKFFRGAEAGSSDEPEGLGLGLSIAQSIAKAHQGSISFDITKPGWTMVRVILPKGSCDSQNPLRSNWRI